MWSKVAHRTFRPLHLYIMNTLISGVANSWTALVFGAVFNLLATNVDENLIVFTIKTLIGGLIWMAFQIWADRIKRRNAQNKDEHKNGEEKKEQ
jgi:hypothetical protein